VTFFKSVNSHKQIKCKTNRQEHTSSNNSDTGRDAPYFRSKHTIDQRERGNEQPDFLEVKQLLLTKVKILDASQVLQNNLEPDFQEIEMAGY
jgi:hypothetical protein